LDLFKQFHFIPLAALLVGLSGSLHCVGMCGGLIVATTNKSKRSLINYHVGRLIGYLFLAFLAGSLGQYFYLQGSNPFMKYLSLVPAILIGVTFIFWGLRTMKSKKFHLGLPLFFHKIHQNLLKKFLKIKFIDPAFIFGLLTFLLPCGLLYGVVMVAVALGSVWSAGLCLFFFWAGTVPGLVLAPQYFMHLMQKYLTRSPVFVPLLFLSLGILTIVYRVGIFWNSQHGPYCH
jgi:sulfite exporter TauE/SafE